VDVRIAQLLDLDPGLADGLTEDERAAAATALPVQAIVLPEGAWEPKQHSSEPSHVGYLVAEGLLVRRVKVAAGSSAELLGRGDVLRPWQEDPCSFAHASWEVLERTEVALLSAGLAADLARWPAIGVNLLARSMRRSRALAAQGATASIVGVEKRLLLNLWQLAEIGGTAGCDGVHVSLRVPHRVLAELVGARRPSVTTALANLQRAGLVSSPPEDGWILHGEPPPL
jgi:CRP-like cAMP-binding protein